MPHLIAVHVCTSSVFIFLLAGNLQAQLPDIPGWNGQGNESGPTVSFVAGNDCGLLEHYQQRINTFQSALKADASKIEEIINQRDDYKQRLNEIKQIEKAARNAETETQAPTMPQQKKMQTPQQVSPQLPQPSTDAPKTIDVGPEGTDDNRRIAPDSSPDFDRLKQLLHLVLEKIDNIKTFQSSQRHALTKADATIASLITKCRKGIERKSDTETQAPVPLGDTIAMSHRLHLARLALAISRSVSTHRDISDEFDLVPFPSVMTDTESDPDTAPQPKDDSERDSNTRTGKSSHLNEEFRQLALTAESYNILLRELMQQDREIDKLLSVIDVQARRMRVERLSDRLRDYADRVSVTAEAVSQQKQQFKRTSNRLQSEIKQTEKQIASQQHRLSVPSDANVDTFTEKRLQEIEQNMLRERLAYLKTKLAYAAFVRDTFVVLHKVAKGESPGDAYYGEHAAMLEPSQREERLKNVTRRLKAWRRQRIQLSEAAASPGNEENRERILQLLSKTTEYCSKQESTLAAGEGLAEIVDRRLARINTTKHGILGVASRVLASLIFIGIAVVLSVIISRVLLRLTQKADKQITRKLSKKVKSARRLYEHIRPITRYGFFALYVFFIISLWLGASYLAVQLVWGIDPGLAHFQHLLYDSLFMVGETEITLLDIIKLISILALTIILSRLIQLFLRRQVFLFFDWDEGVRNAISVVLQYALLIIGFSIGLQYLGLGIETFAVFIGIIGLAIGFGLQKLAGSFASGFVVLFGRPVKKGDFVTTGDLEGQILDVSMRTTTVKTRDNVSVIIPNDELVSQKVINWSHDDPLVRLRVPVGVAYGSDIRKVEKNLLGAAEHNGQLKTSPAPIVLFREFGDSALIFELLVWTTNVRDRFIIVSELNKQIDQRFRDAGITIPFPQRDLHLRSADIAIQPSHLDVSNHTE